MKKQFSVLFVGLVLLPGVAMAAGAGNNLVWNPDSTFKAVAEIPMHILTLVRLGVTALSVLLFAWALWSLGGSALQEAKANSFFTSRPTLSPAQAFVTIFIALVLYSIASSLSFFGATAGLLTGDGETKIQHPVALVNVSDVDYYVAILRAFVYNSMYLIAFMSAIKGFWLWRKINEGKSNAPFSQVVGFLVAAAFIFSFETLYYFAISTLKFPDFLSWLFLK